MSNYLSLKATINANIKQNGNEEITGPILNSVLNAMVDSLAGYHYSGIATPATNPGTPDSNVFYIASDAGTYTNFGGLTVAEGEVAILKYNGTWTKEVTGAATASEVSQLAQKIGDLSNYDEIGYRPLAVTPRTGYYFYFSTLAEVEAAAYQYVELSVQPGEKYRISGYNTNNNIPLAIARKAGTTTKLRAISQSTAAALTGEYTIPEGYDTLYVNGLTASAPVVIEKWTNSPGTVEKALGEIEAKVGDGNIDLTGYEPQTGTKTSGKYIKLNLDEVSDSDYEFISLSVNEGEKFYIEGWNINSSIPVCIFAKTGTTTTVRGMYDSSSKGMNGVVTVPIGYDTMYVNGNVTQFVPVVILKQIEENDLSGAVRIIKSNFAGLSDNIAPLYAQLYEKNVYAGADKAIVVNIARRWDETKDMVWTFENKVPTPNTFFDLRSAGYVPCGADRVQNFICISNTTRLVEGTSDFILPICVGAVNNKNGDFPNDTSLFTGGAHGYNNSALATASATMRQISRAVALDGVPLTNGDRKYGNILTIDVVNNIQGCNTEKADGSGREIIQQHIHVAVDRQNVKVEVTFTALEDVNIYAMDGLGQIFAFTGVRFIGSTSKRGLYTAGQRTVTEDKHTNIVRNMGDTYYFDVCMDRAYGLAQDGGLADYNAMATVANKGYFHLIGETPLALNSGDSVSFCGSYALGKVPATS